MPTATDNNPGANRTNWRTAPFSAWAFHNIRDLLPVAEIPSAPNTPRPLREAPRAFDRFSVKGVDGSVHDLPGFLAATATDAIVVLRDGAIVYEAYFNGNAVHAPHILMSATKSVVGLIAGILSGRGELDLDAEVAHYVPEVAATLYRGATIRQLIDMRTAVELDEAEHARYAAAANWDEIAPGTALGLHDFFATLPSPSPGHAHGGPFRYVSVNTDLFGWVIARATGKSFAELASNLLWRRMGAADGAFITIDRAGAPRCTGGLCATARDFARLGQLVLDGGARGDDAVVPAAWIDDIARGGDRDAWHTGEWGQAFAPISRAMSYRSGWYVIHDAPPLMFAMGIHGQNLFVDRANRMVIAKLSSQADRIDHRALLLTHRAVAEFRQCLAAGED
ncbi:MAG: serine hydrolase [Xanthobacteraceae bacterium]|nr:serine hydrolase [Xanthobacteraceae bacterium]